MIADPTILEAYLNGLPPPAEALTADRDVIFGVMFRDQHATAARIRWFDGKGRRTHRHPHEAAWEALLGDLAPIRRRGTA